MERSLVERMWNCLMVVSPLLWRRGGGRGVVVMLICTALASPSTSNICSELDQKKVDIDVIVQYIIKIR